MVIVLIVGVYSRLFMLSFLLQLELKCLSKSPETGKRWACFWKIAACAALLPVVTASIMSFKICLAP